MPGRHGYERHSEPALGWDTGGFGHGRTRQAGQVLSTTRSGQSQERAGRRWLRREYRDD
ncbi:MAG: D-lyxose/D-mannose family sugar isomerase [Nitrospiraceae bacterium]